MSGKELDASAEVVVISTGGTIAMTSPDGAGGVSPALDGDELVGAVPGITEHAAVRTTAFRQLPGAHLEVADVVALSELIRAELRSGARGVVVTQGTDTIEETAFMLDLLLDQDAPVVVTGAMRPASAAGADGPANLLSAVAVAASEQARGVGVLVVLNEEIHSAAFTRKAHTSRPDAFVSGPGRLGWVAEGVPIVAVRPAVRTPTLPPPPDTAVPVALLTATIGDDGRLLGALPELGYAGAVVEALGGGHVPPGLASALAALVEEIPVVLASRTGAGATLRATYEFTGSERDLLRRGLISSGRLDGPKARVLMTMLLGAGAAREAIAEAFAAFESRSALVA